MQPKNTSYTPVRWEFRELIEEEIVKKTEGKIFYFSEKEFMSSASGRILSMEEIPGKGIFIQLGSSDQIRIDKIITLFGKPGPAYDEYDSYGNSCMECHGGYDD